MSFWCPVCNEHIEKSFHICKDLVIMKKSVFYNNCNKLINCNFIDCAAGMGVAGNQNCFLNGDFMDENCNKFIDEDEWLDRQR